MFDQLFDTSVDGVFMSQYQDAPLDLGTEVFYPSRRSGIEDCLAELSGLASLDLRDRVNARCIELYGTKVRGVNWDRYDAQAGMHPQDSADTPEDEAGSSTKTNRRS